MKKVLILTSKYDEARNDLIRNISKHFSGRVDVKLDFLENFTSTISRNKLKGFISGISLSAFNLVYFSGKRAFLTAPKAIAMCLESVGIPFSGYTSYAGNKLTSLTRLAQNGINIPETVFCSANSIDRPYLDFIQKFGFPIIIKNLNGHQTTGIYVVKTKKQLLSFFVRHNDEQFLFQKFIDIRNEYRVLVIGGKAVSAHTKVSRNYSLEKVGYLNLDEQYNFVDLRLLSRKMISQAEKSAKVLSLDIAGVDICIDKKGRIYIIEVNRDPGIDSQENSPEVLGLVNYFSKVLFTSIQ